MVLLLHLWKYCKRFSFRIWFIAVILLCSQTWFALRLSCLEFRVLFQSWLSTMEKWIIELLLLPHFTSPPYQWLYLHICQYYSTCLIMLLGSLVYFLCLLFSMLQSVFFLFQFRHLLLNPSIKFLILIIVAFSSRHSISVGFMVSGSAQIHHFVT